MDEGGGAQRVAVTATLMDGVLLPTSTTVNVTVSEDSDQYATSGTSLTITIPANQGSGTGSITITPVSDNAFETTASQVTFTGKAQLISGDKDSDRVASASVTIVDDDHEVTLSATPSVVKKADDDADSGTEVTVMAKLVRPAVRMVTISAMVPETPYGL